MAKFSISLPDPMTADLDRIESKHRCGRSRIIQDALAAYFKSSTSDPYRPEDGESDLHDLVREQQQQIGKLTERVDELGENLRQILQAASAASHRPGDAEKPDKVGKSEAAEKPRPVGRPRAAQSAERKPAVAAPSKNTPDKESAGVPRWKVPTRNQGN